MAIRYILKNKRGNYYSGHGKTGFSKDISKAAVLWKSRKDAEDMLYENGEYVQKVDITITEVN